MAAGLTSCPTSAHAFKGSSKVPILIKHRQRPCGVLKILDALEVGNRLHSANDPPEESLLHDYLVIRTYEAINHGPFNDRRQQWRELIFVSFIQLVEALIGSF